MKKQGFTLIELLVVISIIGLLSSIVYTSLQTVRTKAKIAAGLSFSQSLYHVLGAEAVGVWSFETITGNQTPDGSGNGNNGTIYGNPVQEDSGIPALRKALKFNGVNDYVEIGDSNSLDVGDTFTVEAWAKKMENGRIQVIASKQSQSFAISYWSDNKFYASKSGLGTVAISSITITDTNWHHLAWSKSGSTNNIYIDGQDVTTIEIDRTLTNNANALTIGSESDTLYFNGLIDEVRIYRQAMTSAQIRKHYAEGLERLKLAKN